MRYTNKEVGDMVESEGLAYAIQHYCSASRIADPNVATKWAVAKIALDNLENYLRDELGVIE